MKTKLIIVSIIVVLVLAVAGGLMLLRGDEDRWICKNGAWVKQGNPKESRPETSCGNSDEKIIDQSENIPPSENGEENPELIGGERDEHGCSGSAGYTWCEEKKKCLRAQEEECSYPEDQYIPMPILELQPLPPSDSSDSAPSPLLTPDSLPSTVPPGTPMPLPLP